jgi:hypothetical protein
VEENKMKDWSKKEVKYKYITVEQAKAWLSCNFGNRALNRERVRWYMLQLRTDKWEPESDSVIMIAADGRLLNGQHRLTAIVETGIPAWIKVEHDVSESAWRAIDCGMRRSVGVRSGVHGVLAAIAGTVWRNARRGVEIANEVFNAERQ